MYVDGFVLAVPKQNLEKYKAMAEKAGAIWKEHGAIDYVECVADDVQNGELTSFPRAVLAKDDEIVVFSWATYKDRQTRDEVMKKVMSDPRMRDEDYKDVFDGKRMFWGRLHANRRTALNNKKGADIAVRARIVSAVQLSAAGCFHRSGSRACGAARSRLDHDRGIGDKLPRDQWCCPAPG